MSLISTRPLKMILALSLILTLARCPGGGSSDSSAALLGLLSGGGSADTAASLPKCTSALCLNGNVSGLISGASLVIANGAKTYTLPENGSFGLNAQTGDNYTITVQTQPTTLRCVVTNGTGTVEATSIDNIVVTCPMAYKNNLVWNRCTHGQQWNATAGDCTGTGNSGNNYGATTVQYCSTADDSCNDSDPAGESSGVYGHLDGSGTSGLFTACNDLNSNAGLYNRKTWRVPKKSELESLVYCISGTQPNGSCKLPWDSVSIDQQIFPNTVSGNAAYYSSASSYIGFNGSAQREYAYVTLFGVGNGSGYTIYGFAKTALRYVRCASTGP
ncbi:MAG: DUF1566 domain-containing protein [Leptonema illini]|uniref:DUF1566 domain-containing protein n=1 Tax=Leptonema illini TaxID=183 RepID=A0A833LWF9_9LEPT|nr:MAG: DUF1566 domain-containing protein [Leptonema illini]